MSSGLGSKDVSFVPQAGAIFAGQYRIERVLGAGGMGVVLAAVDEDTNTPVAIKLLRATEERRSIDRFFREARAMGQLSTEHVVRVIEAGTADDRPFLVLERLEGQDFGEQTRGGKRLPTRDVVDAMIQACEALSHAHRAGIVHRDLKPSNLFLHVTPEGRAVVKVLDFGISKVKSKEEWEMTLTATHDAGVLGSPPYMSPEQVRDPKKVDARSDVWALGIVMCKLLGGKLPFDGDSVGEVFARVLEQPYPSLRAWGVDVPPELDAVVGKCLAKDRRERFQHTGELALALAPFASPEWASLARALALRMRDDPPTVDDVSSSSVLEGLAGLASVGPGSFGFDARPGGSSPGAAFTPTPTGPPLPGSLRPPIHSTSPSATFGPAVLDPDPRFGGPSRAHGASRTVLAALFGLVVLVVGVALGFGLRARRAPNATKGDLVTVASPDVQVPAANTGANDRETSDTRKEADAREETAVHEDTGDSAASSDAAEPATPPPATTDDGLMAPRRPPVRHAAGRRGTPSTSHASHASAATRTAAKSPSDASEAASAPSASDAPRPELHPNPYAD